MLSDFPKIYCPFIRQKFKIDKKDWEKYGNKLQLREPKAYLIIDEINPGYEWVFNDPDTFAVEKLDGTNVRLLTENGRLIHLQNRKNIIDPLQIIKGKTFIIEGIFNSIQKGYVHPNGSQFGEIIGPKIQGNPYKLNNHEFYPFEKAIKHLRYNSFDEHERTFENWSDWFKDWLLSRYYQKRTKREIEMGKVFAEGVIFYNLRRKAENKTYMAKLRRNMFIWYYDPYVEIIDYSPKNP